MPLDLTLSVVSHGHGPKLRDLLTDLNVLPSLRGVQLIVTLNTMERAPDVAAYPNLRISVVSNASPIGFARNHNRAFERCRTRFFGVLNPDLRFETDPFPLLVGRLNDETRLALVAPRVLSSRGHVEDSVRENLTPWSLCRRHLGDTSNRADAGLLAWTSNRFFWIAGMFILVRSIAFREVGGFDDRFRLYCEDYDLCARLRLAGYSFTPVPETSVVHDAQRQSNRSMKYLLWHLSSLAKVWVSRPYWRVTLRDLRG